MTESNGPLSAALLELHKRIPDDCPEDEVEHLLSETGFYLALGFTGGTGVDVRRKKGTRGVGIPDALLLNSDQSVQVVVEVKRPSEDVHDHLDQLRDYVAELHAPYGLLTNGRQFLLFKREGEEVRHVWAGTESATTLAANPSLLGALRKLTLDPLDFTKVQERIQASLADGLPLRRADDLASTQFLDAFKLVPGSPFAALVSACYSLLVPLLETSEFVGGSFAFWKQVYARKLSANDIPAQWKALSALDGVTEATQKEAEERLYRFSFALETAYTMTARLILAKAIQDHDRGSKIVGTEHLAALLETQLAGSKHARTGRLPPDAYLKSTIVLFNTYARTLFTSIYATDIFDWWRDYPQAEGDTQNRFADAVAQLLLTLLRFDFRELEGDLLGELYQQYFDPETRKALGEFYTPPAVVEFMLDELEYTGQGNLRLLDPATGSGTFIISALRRYLKANASRPPADVLRGITEDYLLVAFDVNPFAIMMAQINFAALLVPLYGKVIQQHPEFVLRRLPIVRTDSLRQENLEGEQQTQGQQQGLNFGADTITAQVILPIRVGKETGLPVSLTFPQVEAAKRAGMVSNVSEWLRALQAVFAGVEKLSQAFDTDRNKPLPDLNGAIRDHLAQSMATPGPLADYLTAPYAQDVWTLLERLKVQHGDGRFLKTLEDLMLGLILKHYLKYDYVVGNPPYVRIQHLPEFQRRYWEDKYQWAHGNFDIYVPFVERAFQANNDPQNGWLNLPDPSKGIAGGRLAYIIPNRFLNAGYAENLRRVLPERAHIRSLLNFGAATFRVDAAQPATKLFREAMVYPAILSAQVGKPNNQSAAFPVVRLRPFELPSSPLDALKAVTETYANLRAGKDAALPADWGDALNQNAAELNAPGHEGAGWLNLTPAERVVWDKLEAVGEQVDPELRALLAQRSGDVPTGSTYRRLKNYTATRSGGFQGVATALDAVMVLKKVAEKNGGTLLQLVPKGGGNPVWIERDALRPFLFGKDVERWHIDYQDWYVLFPYLNTSEGFRLMPSADYRDHSLSENRKAFAGYPIDGPNIETAYPQYWKYLKANETKLRGRENGRYKKRKKDEWRWYDLARPQSLDFFETPKITLQVTSPRSNFVGDTSGYFFAAGGTSGVYGLSLGSLLSVGVTSGIMNSNVADYYIRNVSITFSGGYYSYGDQFIREVPIPLIPTSTRQRLSDLARTLTELTDELRALEGQIQRFPESVNQQLRQQGNLPDLVPLSQVSQHSRLARELKLATMHNGDTDIMGHETLRFGNGQLSGLSSAHADLVRATFAAVPSGKLDAAVLLALNVPERTGAVKVYLDTLAEWRDRTIALGLQITAQEAQLNDTVYTLYGLNASDQVVIEDYLSRY